MSLCPATLHTPAMALTRCTLAHLPWYSKASSWLALLLGMSLCGGREGWCTAPPPSSTSFRKDFLPSRTLDSSTLDSGHLDSTRLCGAAACSDRNKHQMIVSDRRGCRKPQWLVKLACTRAVSAHRACFRARARVQDVAETPRIRWEWEQEEQEQEQGEERGREEESWRGAKWRGRSDEEGGEEEQGE